MPRFAANLTLLFTDAPFLDRFERAARAGFEAVEFLFPYDHPVETLQRLSAAHRLQVVLHNLPPGDWDAGERGIACLPERVDEFRAGVALALRYARALGCPRLHCMAGRAEPGRDARQLRDTLVGNLRHAAAEAQRDGVDLLIEPINCHDIPGYLINRSADAMALIDDVGAPNLRLQYDVYHMQRMEGELAATLQRLLPHVGHIQIADNPGRAEPGSGEINYPYLFDRLDDLGYDGWIGCEYNPAGITEHGLSWLDAARRATAERCNRRLAMRPG